MTYLSLICFFILLISCQDNNPSSISTPEELQSTIVSIAEDTTPPLLQKIVQAYPLQPLQASKNYLIWGEKDTFIFDDNQKKSFEQLLNTPDLEDQMSMPYTTQLPLDTPSRNHDPGRIRVEDFFKKMYGETKQEVQQNLTTITFCGQKVHVTTVNEVDKKLLLINQELQPHLQKWHKYLQNIGGTFNWRTIAGTDRMSMHSFGMTIDINVKYADYWRWNVADKSEDGKRKIHYKNKIPLELVQIFEKHGFIWGGRWYHYDTMHFEYRPELL